MDRDNGNPSVNITLHDDGLRPGQVPWGLTGRNPVERVIPPGAEVEINLNISADRPLVVTPHRQYIGRVTAVDTVVPVGQRVVVRVKNTSDVSSISISDGDILVYLTPLTFDGRWAMT